MILFNKPIEMIANFSEEGVVTPMRFRYAADNAERIVINVDHYEYRDEDFPGPPVQVFDCKSFINGSWKRYQLRFYYRVIKWELYV